MLKLEFDELLSSFGSKFDLRRYIEAGDQTGAIAAMRRQLEEARVEAGAYTRLHFSST